jgi:2,4-dienoyl-CoA reductase-like NADH-dependent reductase (Old Yellow Enzyme family)
MNAPLSIDPLGHALGLPSGTYLKNRIAKAAMSERLADPRTNAPTPRLLRAYDAWAKGGAGLLITGNVMIDRRALGESGNVVVDDDTDLASLSAWADTAHRHGAAIWMQLNHPGRQSPRSLSPEPVAPSAVPLRGMRPAFAMPRALEDHEIIDIAWRFVRTAWKAERAGFNGVQIHAAHGYLISQFLSPITNRRDDAWGGTPDKRMRFLLEIVRGVRASTSSGFAVSVKLNSADFQRGGFGEDESMGVVRALMAEGIDLLEISGGTYEDPAMWGVHRSRSKSTVAREGYFIAYAEKVREIAGCPLMVTGGFRTAAGMREAIRLGATDLIGLARPLAVEPDLPKRLLDGTADRARSVQLGVGVKSIDALLEASWYEGQIRSLGQGTMPAAKAGRWSAFKEAVHALSAMIVP